MELRLNREGVQYELGASVKNEPIRFSQVVPAADELSRLKSEGDIVGFSSLTETQRAKEELQQNLGRLCIYEVAIKRVEGEQVGETMMSFVRTG